MLGRIFQLINQDRSVLYPAMIMEFLNLWLLKLLQQLPEQQMLLVLLIPGLLAIFIHLFTAECARQLILRKNLTIASALGVSLQRYLPALFFSVLLPAPFLAALFLLAGSIWVWMLTPILFLAILFLGVYPVVYVLSGVTAFKVYRAIWLYFRRKPVQIWRIFLFFTVITFCFNALVLPLSNTLPGNVSSVLIPLLGGFRTVLLVYGLVLFFLGDQQISELV